MKPIRLIQGFLTVGSWTMMSRVLGLVRDAWIAAALGTGPVAQAFIIAFSLPNMFRRFFAEGAFNMAFVPMFAKRLEGGENAEGFARDAMGGLATVLIALTIVAQLFMPALIWAMASGYVGDERFDLSVGFGRVAFPYILFISLAALCSGVLNATGRFAAAAAAPVLLNVLFLTALALAPVLGWDAGWTLVWTVPIAGLAQLALVWVATQKAGISLVPRRPRLTPELRRLAIIAAPAMLTGGVIQVNLLVGRQVASYYDGAVAWLYNADRLYQLPLGVVAIAIGIVLLPDLSRRLKSGDVGGSRHALSRAAEFALFLTLPAAVALVVIPGPLISVIFERGAFDAADTAQTALALAIYGIGLPAFVLQKVLQPLYFARENTKTPFYYAVVSMVVNAVLAIGLAPFLGFISAAIGTTIAGWAMTWQLWRGSRRMGEAADPDNRLLARLPRVVIASLAMGVILWGLSGLLSPQISAAGHRYWALAVLVLAGITVYGVAAYAVGAFRMADFRAGLSRQR
ncbi:putative lipid II flippase MurJ [Defluviimonas aquaemixtae]|uniref:Probable lipid II flippase MurJ n=1 Tax=Albidovulum aquaemixtae TaxID=1542388 RepID=A0A2R8B2Y9_9RHOB|nr:murein biosynthesis integral membrane protein MurJ [Defluviimonas aquaemixtae]SPH16900.1 putative lipid II flippase MurJ [Defluviimonas aquaemixtae]